MPSRGIHSTSAAFCPCKFHSSLVTLELVVSIEISRDIYVRSDSATVGSNATRPTSTCRSFTQRNHCTSVPSIVPITIGGLPPAKVTMPRACSVPMPSLPAIRVPSGESCAPSKNGMSANASAPSTCSATGARLGAAGAGFCAALGNAARQQAAPTRTFRMVSFMRAPCRQHTMGLSQHLKPRMIARTVLVTVHASSKVMARIARKVRLFLSAVSLRTTSLPQPKLS